VLEVAVDAAAAAAMAVAVPAVPAVGAVEAVTGCMTSGCPPNALVTLSPPTGCATR